jgi:DNA-binding SARP family transcriptional activator
VAVEYRMLGPLEALVDGRPVRLGGPRQRAVLALLLARAGETMPADRLVDELWGEEPPETAGNTLQGFVSDLRKVLGPDSIVTRGRGYAARLEPDALDLDRFERLAAEGNDALAAGRPVEAAGAFGMALGIWRGPALADLAGEKAVHSVCVRLDELRLAVLEKRIDADLACGRHADVVGELQELVAKHPLRERLRGQLMLALYRCGRQVEALEAYREARRVLVEELGIEPGRPLQELERAILRQDASLDSDDAVPGAVLPGRAATVVAVALDRSRLDALLSIAEPLARRPGRQLIVARLLADGSGLAAETAALAERRSVLAERGVAARIVAYTSETPGDEATLLATENDADLVLVDAPAGLLGGGVPSTPLLSLLEGTPCDVGILLGTQALTETGGPVATPFGGGEHEWAAIELAAWIASALGVPLRLLGTEADPTQGRRDASRLLARASLLVQEVVGIVTEPVLVPPGPDGVVSAARDSLLLVVGLSERWRHEGLGAARLAVVRDAGVPVLLVRRGLRPGGIAPGGSITRFTWSLAEG